MRDFPAVDVPQYDARRWASQHSRDLGCGDVRGSTRHGNNVALGKRLLKQTECVVGRAKVPPLEDAVCLVSPSTTNRNGRVSARALGNRAAQLSPE